MHGSCRLHSCVFCRRLFDAARPCPVNGRAAGDDHHFSVPLGILAGLVIGIASAILVRRQGMANNLSCSSNFSRHRLLRFRISLMVTTFGQVCTSTIGNPNSHSSTGAPSQKMPNRSQSQDVLPYSRIARADRSSHRSVMRRKRRSSSS